MVPYVHAWRMFVWMSDAQAPRHSPNPGYLLQRLYCPRFPLLAVLFEFPHHQVRELLM